MTFEVRSTKFQEELGNLQKKYQIELYASQVLLKNSELAVLIKLRDANPAIFSDIVGAPKTYDDKPKKGNPVNKKT